MQNRNAIFDFDFVWPPWINKHSTFLSFQWKPERMESQFRPRLPYSGSPSTSAIRTTFCISAWSTVKYLDYKYASFYRLEGKLSGGSCLGPWNYISNRSL